MAPRRKKAQKKTKKEQSKTSSKKKTKRKASHAGARQKGLQFEREVANALGHIFPEAKRHLEYQASEIDGGDIAGTDPYKIQCKNYQNYVPIGKIKEVQRRDGTVPVLVTKGNKLPAVACMYFDDWVRLLEMAHGTADMPLVIDAPKQINLEPEQERKPDLIKGNVKYYVDPDLPPDTVVWVPEEIHKELYAPAGESKYDTAKLIQEKADETVKQMGKRLSNQIDQMYGFIECNVCDEEIKEGGVCGCDKFQLGIEAFI